MHQAAGMPHGQHRALAVLLLGGALLVVLAQSAHPEEAPAGALPFPTEKSQTLRGKGAVFVVDGAIVIPKNVEIGVELDTRIVGINQASIDVQGGLKVRGTQDHWVKIEGIDFSPTRAPAKDLHLDMVDLRTCRFVHDQGEAFVGTCTIENACIQRDCAFDFRIGRGMLNLLTITWGVPCAIRLEAPAEEKPDIIVQCHGSLMRETTIRGQGDVRVRNAEVRGGLTAENTLKLTVDGCDISGQLVLRQPPEGLFKDITLTKCNLWDGTVVRLLRPSAPDQKKERVFFQKFFFGKKDESQVTTDPKAIEKLVSSDADTVIPKMDKPRRRKHRLVNYDLMDIRVPMLSGG